MPRLGRFLRRTLIMATAVSLSACGWMQSHSRGGTAWNQACAAHASVGCPCNVNKDCETSWCVSGECEHYMP